MGDLRISNPMSYYLNDNVINDYMRLIVQNYPDVYVFDSFFYQNLKEKGYKAVRRWTKKVDLFSKRKVLIPINLLDVLHWVMICIDLENKRVEYYDSLMLKDFSTECLHIIFAYLIEEQKDKKGTDLNESEWSLVSREDIPKQRNGYDCGVFLCTYSEYLARGAPFNFTNDHMKSFRQLIAYELTYKRLVDVTVDTCGINEFIQNTINRPPNNARIL